MLKYEARQIKRNCNIDIIVIDYISVITTLQNNTLCYEQVAFLSRNIRVLAFFEFEISIIVLSQVARRDEVRDSGLSTLGENRVH
ncbi:DnaB-like helicase C-terminal domain-containing protein [Borreliella garinii]|uniref:DnaB-like helicase C-terminal domain-containing protein n=1 Tax=Borreliella garinii TaxID=29519 RepID=UPI0004E0B58F|nr:DnaB-like helicase C-terminal domain-containing protein [Borreliella garinii]